MKLKNSRKHLDIAAAVDHHQISRHCI